MATLNPQLDAKSLKGTELITRNLFLLGGEVQQFAGQGRRKVQQSGGER